MKKTFFIMVLCALTVATNASTYNYLCAITEMHVDTLKNNTKNQYTLSWTQKCKNTAEYSSKPEGTYTTTVKLVLNSDDRTLEGTYTTIGADPDKTSANVNDQTIGLVTSELYYGNTRRLLRSDSVSTFTIIKIDDTHYGISEGRLCFTAAALQDRNKHTYNYNYCYAEDEILTQGIEPKPYVFGFSAELPEEIHTHYDMTVNGVFVERNDNGYGTVRYFLTLNCEGTNRTNGSVRNYEVQLEILPAEESIAGVFATNAGQPLFAMDSYVRDLKAGKTRYLAKDSVNSIEIKDKGNKQYSFYGGTLICTDYDANYMAVYGKKIVTESHYYHFSDNGGAGIVFGYDETSKSTMLTVSDLSIETIPDGFRLNIKAAAEAAKFDIVIELESEQLAGTFTIGNGLSLWSRVTRGTTSNYVDEGSTVTINAKNAGTYTLSGSLLCENGITYVLQAFDFNLGAATGIDHVHGNNIQCTKVLRNGVMVIEKDGKTFTLTGEQIR